MEIPTEIFSQMSWIQNQGFYKIFKNIVTSINLEIYILISPNHEINVSKIMSYNYSLFF